MHMWVPAMSVNIGQITTDITVDDDQDENATRDDEQAATSSWAKQEAQRSMQRRASELQARTISAGYRD